MTRLMDPVLRALHERANPATCDIVEISAPDVGKVLRRANDQFLTATPAGPRVSETPAGSSNVDANGALTLDPTSTQIAAFTVENSEVQFGATVDPSTIIKGVGWTAPAAFGRIVLRKFTARIHKLDNRPLDLALQIYRPRIQRYVSGTTEHRIVTFLELLPEPVVVRYSTINWGGTDFADWIFDLSHLRPEISPELPGTAVAVDRDEVRFPYVIFSISPVNPPRGGILAWRIDQTTPIAVANYGTFQEIAWTRPANQTSNPLAWAEAKQNYTECCKLEIELYDPTSTLVYEINLGAAPGPDSTGRIVFERGVPTGGAATIELSTAGSGGPWAVVKHGDPVATKQQTYHLRLTLTAPTGNRHTPRVQALGIEFRTATDISAEVTIEPVVHEVTLPYGGGAIGEGGATIVRHGRRDYRDVASDLTTKYPVSKLELDHYVGSRHPRGTRDRWLHYDRVAVTGRDPGEGAERFGLLSPLKALKKKVPARAETINKTHTVQAGTTTNQVVVTPNLDGASGTGSYAGRGYYMRVRKSAQVGMPPGFIAVIDNNTNLNTLNFTTALPGTLVAGDEIEVHSAVFAQPSLQWVDQDLADIWWEILTVHLLIPAEKIGLAGVGQALRSGLPPRVTDRAPGDATTQAKLKVTLQVQDAQDADELLDQVSFLLGGCTVAIGGQIVFRQLYPLRNAAGDITVPTAPATIAFDARDYTGLQTPTGLEQRITSLGCDYGVNTTLVSDETPPAKSVQYVDADAVAYLAEQDVEGLGSATIPAEIARWCFNSVDEGFFLAAQITRQVVEYASTGLRVWSWSSVDAKPEVHVGDKVWIVTDQYTDYDPTRKLAIRGWWAFQLIVVHVSGGGRRFRGLMPGLGAASQIKGGAGTLAPPAIPAAGSPPTATITFVSRTRTAETVQLAGTPGGAGPVEWRSRTDGGVWTAWQTSALPQNLVVTRAPFWTIALELQVKQGDGQITTSAPYHIPQRHDALDEATGRKRRAEPADDGDYDLSSTTNNGRTAHSGVTDSTAREIRRQLAKPLFSDPDNLDSVGNGTTYGRPLNTALTSGQVDLAKAGVVGKTGHNITRSNSSAALMANVVDRLTDSGHADSAMQESGGKAVNRLLAKALNSDPDNADSVLAGTVRRVPLVGATDATGNVDLAGAAWVNKHGGNLATSATRTQPVRDVVQNITDAGHAAGALQESGGKAVNRLYAKSLSSDADAFGSIADDLTYKKVLGVSSGLITPSSVSGRNRCKAYKTVDQTIANATADSVAFDAENFDVGSLHDTVTNNMRITVPTGGGGRPWMIYGQIEWAPNGTGYRELAIVKNNTSLISISRVPTAAAVDLIQYVAVVDVPADGDYYSLQARQTSGGNLAVRGGSQEDSHFGAVDLW